MTDTARGQGRTPDNTIFVSLSFEGPDPRYSLAGGLGIYVAGQQDYGAWMQARESAAVLAYRQVDPAQVDAGYEAYGVHAVLPLFERTGTLPASFSDDRCQPSLLGPPHPLLELRLSTTGDSRPGVSYTSLASGRVVLAPPGPAAANPACPGR